MKKSKSVKTCISIIISVFPILLVLSLGSTPALATFGTVTGTVTENGIPIEGARVVFSGVVWTTTDSEGHYTWQVQAGTADICCFAPDGAYIGSQTVTVAAGETVVVDFPPKEVPVAVAEPGLDVEGNLILDGSKSSDSDGTIVSWNWELANRDPAGYDFTASGELVATDTIDIGVYDVTLTVTDNDGLTDTDTMVLAVPLTIQNISTIIQEPGDRGEVLRELIREIISPPGQQKR